MKPATELIHAGAPDPEWPSPLTPPVYETTTFVFASAAEVVAYNEGRSSKYLYSRYGNPTLSSVERQLAALDQAEAALVFSSGMGAITTTLMAHARAGDEVVCSAAIYGGTLHLLNDVLVKFGVRPRFVSIDELGEPERVIGDATRIVWFESPINPTLRCVDIQRIAAACRSRGVLSVIDNTFASPINQQPLSLGVDLSMQSATKYLNGHSDVTGGVVTGGAALVGPIERARRLLGTLMDPYPAYALGRGLKTLPLRIAQHNANALAVARFSAGDQRRLPGLLSGPAVAPGSRNRPRPDEQDSAGWSASTWAESTERAERLYDRLKVVKRAASLGGIESLVSMPVLTSQWGHSDEQLRAAGRHQGHAAAVGRPRRRRRPHCRPRSGAGRVRLSPP